MIRPEILDINDDILKIEISQRHSVHNEKNEFVDIFIYPTLILPKQNEKNKKYQIPFAEKMFTHELGKKFNGYTYGIGKIVRLAELNNDKLHNLIKLYFTKNDLGEFYERSSECKKSKEKYNIEKNIENLTYGNLRNILGYIIKTDNVFYNIIELNNDIKRKKFRKEYLNYIIDRDRFTHGKLFFLYPNFEPILRIKNEIGVNKYINYNNEIFISNLKTFEYLTKVIDEMYVIIKN